LDDIVMTRPTGPPRPLAQKLMWFVALWLLGAGTVATVAWVLRLWIAPH
jgi:hypothetical protein